MANVENFFGNNILIHNSWCCFGYHPEITHPIVTSKGLSDKGLIFKMNERNHDNLYVRALRGTEFGDLEDVVTRARREGIFGHLVPFYILGEVFGPVQDLKYGSESPQFRVFDIYVGHPGQGRYVDTEQVQTICTTLRIQTVPIIYIGPFSKEKMDEVTAGKETVSGQSLHIREGVVIRPIKERSNTELGRVVLKSVSEQYLLRKGNTTEFN